MVDILGLDFAQRALDPLLHLSRTNNVWLGSARKTTVWFVQEGGVASSFAKYFPAPCAKPRISHPSLSGIQVALAGSCVLKNTSFCGLGTYTPTSCRLAGRFQAPHIYVYIYIYKLYVSVLQ